MKKLSTVAPLFVLMSLLLSSCLKDTVKREYTIRRPVFALKEDVYNNIGSNAPRPVEAPGKMFLLGNFIYLTETGKGIHIIDRTNPNNLVNVSFIPIPGNGDVAVKDNVLYADCSVDLLAIDVSDPANVSLLKYVPNVFPHRRYIDGHICDSNRVIVDWIVKDTLVEAAFVQQNGFLFPEFSGSTMLQNEVSGSGSSSPGIAGSMSRFCVAGSYLYTVSNSSLTSFNVNTPANPTPAGSSYVGWNIETIFPFGGNLFIGSQSGMYIYSLATPASPQQLSMFAHATQCDPVIADGQYAYVTLRSGRECEGFSNQLEVVNIANLSSPQLVQTLPLTNPRGLSKTGHLLFVCDGPAGLRILDALTPSNVVVSKTIMADSPVNDVITWNGIAYVVADKGLHLYDFSAYPDVTPLGTLDFNR